MTNNDRVPNYELDSTVTDPAAVSSEVQKWTLTGVGPTKKFTVEIDGEKSTSTSLVGNASAAAVQAALEKLSNFEPGDVVVSGSAGGPYTVTYQGDWAEVDVPTPVFTAEEGSVASETVTAGGAPTNAVKRGTGAADREADVSVLEQDTPLEKRAKNSGEYD